MLRRKLLWKVARVELRSSCPFVDKSILNLKGLRCRGLIPPLPSTLKILTGIIIVICICLAIGIVSLNRIPSTLLGRIDLGCVRQMSWKVPLVPIWNHPTSTRPRKLFPGCKDAWFLALVAAIVMGSHPLRFYPHCCYQHHSCLSRGCGCLSSPSRRQLLEDQ